MVAREGVGPRRIPEPVSSKPDECLSKFQTSDRQQIVVALEVTGVVSEGIATKVGFNQRVPLDHGTHATIEEHDALSQEVMQVGYTVDSHTHTDSPPRHHCCYLGAIKITSIIIAAPRGLEQQVGKWTNDSHTPGDLGTQLAQAALRNAALQPVLARRAVHQRARDAKSPPQAFRRAGQLVNGCRRSPSWSIQVSKR